MHDGIIPVINFFIDNPASFLFPLVFTNKICPFTRSLCLTVTVVIWLGAGPTSSRFLLETGSCLWHLSHYAGSAQWVLPQHKNLGCPLTHMCGVWALKPALFSVTHMPSSSMFVNLTYHWPILMFFSTNLLISSNAPSYNTEIWKIWMKTSVSTVSFSDMAFMPCSILHM